MKTAYYHQIIIFGGRSYHYLNFIVIKCIVYAGELILIAEFRNFGIIYEMKPSNLKLLVSSLAENSL